MNKNDNNNFENELTLKRAAISLAEKDSELFNSLEKDNTIINPNQNELDKKIHLMINDYFNENDVKLKKKKSTRKFLLKIATITLIIFSGFIVPFITVDAFRERVLNFYIENFDTHASFTSKDENRPSMTFEVNYIPEGYNENDEYRTEDLYSHTYYNIENKMIDITLYGRDTSFNVDIENCKQLNVTINNKNGYIYRKTGFSALIYKFHENSIVISSNDDTLSNEELIQIANSIN